MDHLTYFIREMITNHGTKPWKDIFSLLYALNLQTLLSYRAESRLPHRDADFYSTAAKVLFLLDFFPQSRILDETRNTIIIRS